jgi:hypothetical protein
MHLAIVAAEPHGGGYVQPPAGANIDAAILAALEHAASPGLPRASLRAMLRVRNERLGEALTRLAASGQIARHGDTWIRVAVPVPAHTHTRLNGNRKAAAQAG